jgi:hypothetical protein
MKESDVPSHVEQRIYFVRSTKVMIDEDLARLYQVETRTLIQAVKRNIKRFPDDFMFQLTTEEYEALRSQIVISAGKTGRRYAPYAFTEQGIAMLSGVLRSDRAITINIEIMRAFVRLRSILREHQELRWKLEELEKRYDHQFKIVFDAIRDLIPSGDQAQRRKIGFGRNKKA